jgi:hypothetical protein
MAKQIRNGQDQEAEMQEDSLRVKGGILFISIRDRPDKVHTTLG